MSGQRALLRAVDKGAVTLAEGGNRKSSRLLWQQIQQSATDDWFRNEADRRLKQLDAMDQIDLLTKVVTAFSAVSLLFA
jgi:hypothetical protein